MMETPVAEIYAAYLRPQLATASCAETLGVEPPASGYRWRCDTDGAYR